MLSSIVVVVIVTEFVCINFSEFFDVDVYVVGGGLISSVLRAGTMCE